MKRSNFTIFKKAKELFQWVNVQKNQQDRLNFKLTKRIKTFFT